MTNKDKIILDLCGGTGAWTQFYKENGFDVRVLTLPDYDVTAWKENSEIIDLCHSNKVYGICAAPPCTMFSQLRNDVTAKEPRDLRQGMKVVLSCMEIVWECLYSPHQIRHNSLKFWALENPKGYLLRFLGKPALIFSPHEYGADYSKKTCLWGMFNEPIKTFTTPPPKGEDYIRRIEKFQTKEKLLEIAEYRKKTGYPSKTVLRSITPSGFSKAFYEANS